MKFVLKTTLLSLLGAATFGAGILATAPALGRGLPALQALELSEGQRTEMDRILAQGRSDIQALLTAEQQAAFTAALDSQAPYGIPRALRSVNLSPQQRTQVQGVMRSTWGQLAQVLTPEQRQQWQSQGRGQWQSRRQQGRGQQGDRPEGRGSRGGWEARLAALNLTPEQQSQMQALLAQRQGAIAASLTPEQRAAFQETWQSSQNLWQALQAANLTQSQRMALREQMQGLRQDMAAILTEEQRQQLRP